MLHGRSFQGLGRLRYSPCPDPPRGSGEHTRDARDPDGARILHAAEEHFRLAIEQFQDLAFEVPLTERHARQMSKIDRGLVPNGRG